MSFGKMNSFIQLKIEDEVEDEDGYSTIEEVTVASVRAYREYRSGTKRVTVTTAMILVCEGSRFVISSIEDVAGRGMYIEVLAKEVKQG